MLESYMQNFKIISSHLKIFSFIYKGIWAFRYVSSLRYKTPQYCKAKFNLFNKIFFYLTALNTVYQK